MTTTMHEYYSEQETKRIAQEYKELLKISYQKLSEEDNKLIRKAFDIAVDAHKNQRRRSGEPYIFHPIAVAKIVASQIGLDSTAIASALLHDVVEDTPYTEEDMKELFGETIAKIVRGLTKISVVSKKRDISVQSENYKKLILTIVDDIRVVLIKIADRLHNMQTMDSMPAEKQVRIAAETSNIYAPLAHRIGLYNIKTELEDLALKYSKPKSYAGIETKIKQSEVKQNEYLEDFIEIIRQELSKYGISAEIKGRFKSIFSIYRKMKKEGITYDDVYDKYAIRIVYPAANNIEEVSRAWVIKSIVTDKFPHNESRDRDWISKPRPSGYSALHTTVLGPGNRWVEVQIRSEKMHEIAEFGYAAHFKYKNGEQKMSSLENWLTNLQEILTNSNVDNPLELIDDFKLNLYNKEISVFTPKGEVKILPKNSTALDFAFAIHSEVGLKTIGIKVQNKLVPLNHPLQSGDTVEVITSENASPNSGWLNYVTTPRALSKIRSVLRETEKQIAIEGKEILRRKLKSQKIDLTEDVVNELVNFFKTKTSLEIFYRVGQNIINNQMIKEFADTKKTSFFERFIKATPKIIKPKPKTDDPKNYDIILFGEEEQALPYQFPKCCNPIAGDSIFGFNVLGEGIKVHKSNCPNAVDMHSRYGHRILKAKWAKQGERSYIVNIFIKGIDHQGVVGEITSHIYKNHHIEVNALQFKTNAGVFEGNVSVSVNNNIELNTLIGSLKKLNGVEVVERVLQPYL